MRMAGCYSSGGRVFSNDRSEAEIEPCDLSHGFKSPIHVKRDAAYATSQTVDKVHGICRGFFFIKVLEAQYLSGIEALFLV